MSLVARYVLRHYLRAFATIMFAATAIFLVVDLVDRLADYSEYAPTAASLATFYLLRLPRILTDVYPGVSLLAVLVSLGILARHRELLALRACGIGPWQISAPLLAGGALVSLGAFLWNETIVPPTSAEARHVKDVVIKRRDFGLLDARSLWFQDRQGFVNIDYFDAAHHKLHGLKLYVADDSFRLRRIIEVPIASWNGRVWQTKAGSVKEFDDSGRFTLRPLKPGEFQLDDAPAVIAKHRPHAEEFTVRELRDRIVTLEARGLDAAELRVDLHAKFALPVSGLVSVLVGFPLAVRGGRRFAVARNVSVGLIAGFAYWVTLAVAVSAGRTGLLPPLVSAWSPNVLFAALGAAMHGWSER